MFVFHPLATHPQALAQSSSSDKTPAAVCAPLLQVCASRGVPDFRQIDNDAAFTGLGKTPSVLGRFVRLALYWGIELIFIPPGEPKRHALVEGLPHLWAQSFWNKKPCASVKAFQRKSPQFLAWDNDYAPPALPGLTVKEARRGVKRRQLPPRVLNRLPPDLPGTAGRRHFIRRVNERGASNIRKEEWKVSRHLAGEYVWVPLDLSTERLEIYHRRSKKAKAKVVKTHSYPIEERVARVTPG